MNQEIDEKHLVSLDDNFEFSCHEGLPCYNKCCCDINIFLSPYDVLRIRKGIGLPSEEFLEKYTIALVGEEGLPLVVLKLKEDENKTCPFVTQEGCGIYQERPWSCRMYPIFPLSSEEQEFLIEEKSSCLGFMENRARTMREWKTDQNIDLYDKMNQTYKDITRHDYFLNGNKLDKGKTKLIYTACYDLDAFRRFLFETRFFEIYEVEEDVINKMKADDEALLDFGYQWVKFTLFSEGSLRLKDKAMDKLLQSKGKVTS
jgi:uncharacterized protein